MMILRRLEIKNFRSVENALLQFNPQLGNTWSFVGKNDVGKTNLVNAIDFLFQWDRSDLIQSLGRPIDSSSPSRTYSLADRRAIFNRKLGKIIIKGELEYSEQEIIDTIGKESYNVLLRGGVFRKNEERNIRLFVEVKLDVNPGNCVLHPRTIRTEYADFLWKNPNEGWYSYQVTNGRHAACGVYEPSVRVIDSVGTSILDGLNNAVLSIKSERGLDGGVQGSDIIQKIRLEQTSSGGIDRSYVELLTENLKTFGVDVSELSVRRNDITGKDELYYGKIPHTQVGSGVNFLLIISMFEVDTSKKILLLEEPEIHLHPQAQKNLIRVLMDKNEGKQIILTTHSPIVAASLKPDAVILVRKENGRTVVSSKNSEDIAEEIITELGVVPSDYGLCDLIVFGEGDTDKAVLETFARKLGFDLKIMFIGCEGVSTIADYANAALVSELRSRWGVPLFVVHDGDVYTQDKRRDQFERMLRKLRVDKDHVIGLQQPSIESYLLNTDVLMKAFPEMSVIKADIESDIAKYVSSRNKKEVLARLLMDRFGIRYDAVVAGRIAASFEAKEIDEEISSLLNRVMKTRMSEKT